MTPASRYLSIKEKIQSDAITLVVVTKNQPVEKILEIYEAGCRDFGENRVQEALPKIAALPSDIRWHFIGTLQANKVNKVVENFHLIHSVDHPKLAHKISEVSQKRGIETSILLQVNTSGEASKHGLSATEWLTYFKEVRGLPHLRVEGLMTMAPDVEDEERIRACFRQLRQIKESHPTLFHHLSMGMSHDYPIAIEEGATLLRVGSAIFN